MIVSHAITDVTVFARGALVTRKTGPIDAAGDALVVLAGITPLATPGSFRVRVEGGARRVASVHAKLVVPEERMKEGPSRAKVSELSAERERKAAERAVLSERRAALAALSPRPHVVLVDAESAPRDKPSDRFADAISVLGFSGRALADVDERIVSLSTEVARLDRELAALEVEARETSRAHEWVGHPTRSLSVALVGAGRVEGLTVTYAVDAACWWPAHTIRLTGDGRRGEWLFEALVVQASREDWADVHLTLSSADMELDATLPELPSLRFGRAQPRSRTGYRRPPEGLDGMFAAFDRAFPAPPAPHTSRRLAAQDDFSAGLEQAQELEAGELADGRGAPPPVQRHAAAPPGSALDALVPQQQAMPVYMPEVARSKSRGGLLTAGAAVVAAPAVLAASAIGAAFGGGAREEGAAEPEAPELDVDGAWLDFDRLSLAAIGATSRGRLVLAPDAASRDVDDAVRRAEAAREQDFRDKRGMYDHRYDAAERASVAADDRPRRVTVALAAVAPSMQVRAAPVVEPSVFREARIENPFPFPVLGGAAQVLVDGTLVAKAEAPHVDRGGTVTLGCGTEERIKVVRNVRATEESAGLLGGSLAVRHAVEIEVSSSLGYAVDLVVIERLPVTEDKAIEIELEETSPRAEPYDQADRGAPIKGGYSFALSLEPGASAVCKMTYVLTFSSKLEILGGNRRG